MNYQVKRIVVGELCTNCYVIINDKNEALILDPGDDKDKILDFVKGLKIVGILVTHKHFDHIGALEELESFFSLKANEKNNSFVYEVIETKGHTEDSVSFYFPSIQSVFVGDFIFKNGIGRMDLGGNTKEMRESISKFLEIFSDVKIFPGHGDFTFLEWERDTLEHMKKTL